MRLPYAPPGRERVPARGLLRNYLAVERPGPIPAEEIARKLGGRNSASVFCVGAVRAGLLVRLRWGVYAAPSREATALAMILPWYFARLIALDSALGRAGIRHAFACLAAIRAGANFVPDEPLGVVRLADFVGVSGAGVFGVDAFSSRLVSLRTEDGACTFRLAAADPWTAARVFAAVGMPREAAVARHLLRGLRMTRRRAEQLNALGLAPLSDVLATADPGLRAPARVDAKKRAFGEMARRNLQAGGG